MKKYVIYIIVGVLVILMIAVTIRLAQEDRGRDGANEPIVYQEIGEAGKLHEGMVGITSANYNEVVTNSTGVVVVDFFSPRCPFCTRYAPVFASVASEYRGRIVFGKFDVSRESSKASELRIEGTPETRIFENGKEVGRIGGFVEAERLRAEIEKALSE